jgi:ABC-type uncharacterized transport system ATPase subunit
MNPPPVSVHAQKVKLFAALRLLAEQGKAILFVSHKLEDVEGLCTRVASACARGAGWRSQTALRNTNEAWLK